MPAQRQPNLPPEDDDLPNVEQLFGEPTVAPFAVAMETRENVPSPPLQYQVGP